MTRNEPLAVCNDPKDYVRIALAMETLAYHDKNYLNQAFQNKNHFSEEMQLLLIAALKDGDG